MYCVTYAFMKIKYFFICIFYLLFLSYYSNIYSSDLYLKDDNGYRLKDWNLYFQPEEDGNYALGLEKKIAMKKSFGVSFQK